MKIMSEIVCARVTCVMASEIYAVEMFEKTKIMPSNASETEQICQMSIQPTQT